MALLLLIVIPFLAIGVWAFLFAFAMNLWVEEQVEELEY